MGSRAGRLLLGWGEVRAAQGEEEGPRHKRTGGGRVVLDWAGIERAVLVLLGSLGEA